MIFDVIVIGGGCAGLTASIYTARAKLNTLLFTGNDIGGLLAKTSIVENFPGFPDGISGFDLLDNMQQQSEKFGTKIEYDNILKIEKENKLFKVYTKSECYLTKSVIIATGSSPKKIKCLNVDKFENKGISYCATCDGAIFKDKIVSVVGGGDTAMEEALFLTQFCKKVYLIHRRDKFRASNIMIDKVKNNEKINIYYDFEIFSLNGDEFLESIIIKNNKTNEKTMIYSNGLFIAIGHSPETELFDVEKDCNGYIKTFNNSTMTSIEGIFSCGDCIDPIYRQAILACGIGCKAGIDCFKYINR